MNDLFQRFGSMMPLPGPLQNVQNVMQKFGEFRKTVNGDPETMVRGLLQNGTMSQQQFNQLSQWARFLEGMMK